jgi:Trk-type K+ transport system membrane component
MIFYLYFTIGSGKIVDHFLNDEKLQPHTHAIYLAVSSFQNNGLTMTPSSVMDFTLSPILLNTVGALIVCGNTGLPIMVRLIATAWHNCCKQGSDKERVLSFLLQHPRRCFTHMFPAVHTAWLLLVIVTLNTGCTAISVWQDYNSVAMKDLNFMDKVWNALFQSISSRTAGFNSVNIADLSQATTFLLAFMMYLATTPTVVVMRFSATDTELDITGRKEGIEEEVLTGDNSIKTQARRYLSQDLFYLGLILFFIFVFERKQFETSASKMSPNSDGIYYDFSFFKCVFELISAYGTCGLSLGFRDQSASFSGVWTVPSQMLLTAAMVLGRLRGLPDSIDPSVRVAMSPVDEGADGADHKFIKV